MIHILATYFESKDVPVWVLIMYHQDKKDEHITLHQILFFENELDIVKHVKENRLEIRDELISDLVIKIKAYLSGEVINLHEDAKDLGIQFNLPKSQFYRSVLIQLSKLPHGTSTTYFELGKRMDSRAYRAIGNACRTNPLPLIIPCHRVLRKDGSIGGFMGESDSSWQINLKKKLLNLEGIDLN